MKCNLTVNAYDRNGKCFPTKESKYQYNYLLQYLKQRPDLVCITHLVHLFNISARRWASELRPLLVLGKIRSPLTWTTTLFLWVSIDLVKAS